MALPKAASELRSMEARVASHQVADDQEKSFKRRYTISASFGTLSLANDSFNLRLFPCRTTTRFADTNTAGSIIFIHLHNVPIMLRAISDF